MAVQKSNYAKFKYSTNVVGSITSLTFAIDGNVIETNSFDTASITTAILGRRTVTASIQGLLDNSDDTGQVLLLTDFLNASNSLPSDFEAWSIAPPTPTTGDVVLTGACIVTNYTEDRGDDGDGLSTYSVDIRITSITRSVTA